MGVTFSPLRCSPGCMGPQGGRCNRFMYPEVVFWGRMEIRTCAECQILRCNNHFWNLGCLFKCIRCRWCPGFVPAGKGGQSWSQKTNGPFQQYIGNEVSIRLGQQRNLGWSKEQQSPKAACKILEKYSWSSKQYPRLALTFGVGKGRVEKITPQWPAGSNYLSRRHSRVASDLVTGHCHSSVLQPELCGHHSLPWWNGNRGDIWDHFSKPLLPQPGRILPGTEQRPKYQCVTEENRKEAAVRCE